MAGAATHRLAVYCCHRHCRWLLPPAQSAAPELLQLPPGCWGCWRGYCPRCPHSGAVAGAWCLSLRGIWWVLWHLDSLSFQEEVVAAAENLSLFPLLLSLFPPARPEGSPPSPHEVGVGVAV